MIVIEKMAFTSDFTATANPEGFHGIAPAWIKKVVFGGLYDSKGELIESSIRLGGFGGDHVISLPSNIYSYSSERVKQKLSGKSIYLGPLLSHYGHFITEGLSRLWPMNFSGFDHVVFSKFIWGTNVPEYIFDFLSLFGIQREKVFVLDTGCLFEEVWIPEQKWYINKPPRPEVSIIYDFIKSKASMPKIDCSRVFLSYKEKNKSRLNNLSDVEEVFKDHGFLVIEPENLNIFEQIDIYRNASILAGTSGSAMHNALFMKKGASIIEVGDYRSPNDFFPMQKFANEISGVVAHKLKYRAAGCNMPGHACLNSIKESLLNII